MTSFGSEPWLDSKSSLHKFCSSLHSSAVVEGGGCLGEPSWVMAANVTGSQTTTSSSYGHTERGLNLSPELQFRTWLNRSTRFV